MAQVLAHALVALGLCAVAISCQRRNVAELMLVGGASGSAAGSGRSEAAVGGASGIPGNNAAGAGRVGTEVVCEDKPSQPLRFSLSWRLTDDSVSVRSLVNYDGPATIESSSASVLLLRFINRLGLVDGGADAGVEAELAADHIAIEADPGSLPLLPVGKRVWLAHHADPDVTPLEVFPKRMTSGSSFSVRARQGGQLIAAAASVPGPSAPLGSLSVSDARVICTRGAFCFEAGREYIYSMAIHGGGSIVRVDDGMLANVTSGAITYDVQLSRARRVMGEGLFVCADSRPDTRLLISAQALPSEQANAKFELD